MKNKHVIIPFFVPHLGCPYDCVFCNQKKIAGVEDDLTAETIHKNVEIINKSLVTKNFHLEIAFFGGSFTGINQNKQEELLSAANFWFKKGIIKDIRISTRPDYINEVILENLTKYNVSIIELGVQSLDEGVLKATNRGHTVEDVIFSSSLIKDYKIKLGLQMMIGLPEDNYEKDILTAKKIISLSPNFVRIYPTLVIRNTYLEKLYNSGYYTPLTLNESISISKELYKLFKKNNIDIIRMGIQPTENITFSKDVIAGPFHPAFRQLVESELYRDSIEKTIKKMKSIKYITFEVNPKDISKLVGNRKSNFLFLQKKYNIHQINIINNSSLKRDNFILKTENYNIHITPI